MVFDVVDMAGTPNTKLGANTTSGQNTTQSAQSTSNGKTGGDKNGGTASD